MGHLPTCATLAIALLSTATCKAPSDKAPAPEDTKHSATVLPGARDAAVTEGDPMFPTQVTAGSKQIFFLEEPDRGKHITEAAMPTAKSMTWSRHAYCELEAAGLLCSPTAPHKNSQHWRVGKREGVTLAERWQGDTRSGRILLSRNAAGLLTRVVVFGDDDTVDWARSYEQPGVRYSERARNGANQLSGCGFMKVTTASDGRADSVTCLQWLLSPMSDARGVATTKLRRNAAGFVIEERRFDIKGAPANGHDGVHRIGVKRDDAGRVTNRTYSGVKGAPVTSANGGCAEEATRYSPRGLASEWRCLGTDGKLSPKRTAPVKRFRYDARGCRTREALFSAALTPVARDGVHAETWESDAQCRHLRHRCVGLRSNPTECGHGLAAEIRYRRNKAGLVVSKRHYDAKGKPAGDGEMGVFELRLVHDDKGNTIERSCWNEDGAPIECSRTGYHASVGSYDQVGRRVTTRFLDTERKPASNVGIVVRRDRHDNYDHLHTTENLGADGKPLEALGAASRLYLYDLGHKLFGIVLRDRAGKPARYRGCFTGRTCPGIPWHAMRVVRDNTGRAVRNLYFDHKRMLIHAYECSRAQCWGRKN